MRASRSSSRDRKVDVDELKEKATSNWYIEAEEARELGLILDVI